MLKRIMITGVMVATIALASLSTSMPARAASGFANNSAKSETALVSESGDVHLPGVSGTHAEKAHSKNSTPSITPDPIPPPPKPKKIKWTPQTQAMWQIRHTYHKVWNAKNEYACLNKLWTRESGWNKHATNPYSGAYGIPQALPPDKMASAGSNWENSASTQIKWGLKYIREVYLLPCHAWDHEVRLGWYLVNEHEAKMKYLGNLAVKTAEKYLGCPSETGGIGPCVFDCSGLIYRTYLDLGQKNIPRTSEEQYAYVDKESAKDLIPGDLVFFVGEGFPNPGHVAMYIGHGKIIQANAGPTVEISDLSGAEYYGRVPSWKPKN